MNVRLFLTSSSLLLLSWMAASYLSEVSVESHLTGQQNDFQEEPVSTSDATLVIAR